MSTRMEVKPLKADMPNDMQNFIVNQVEGQLSQFDQNPSMELNLEPVVQRLADALKKQYQAFSAYVPQRLYHVKVGRFVVLAWQSSSY
ncbi:hypothetical protein SprV_0301024700 [Sparganum proliferum]